MKENKNIDDFKNPYVEGKQLGNEDFCSKLKF